MITGVRSGRIRVGWPRKSRRSRGEDCSLRGSVGIFGVMVEMDLDEGLESLGRLADVFEVEVAWAVLGQDFDPGFRREGWGRSSLVRHGGGDGWKRDLRRGEKVEIGEGVVESHEARAFSIQLGSLAFPNPAAKLQVQRMQGSRVKIKNDIKIDSK